MGCLGSLEKEGRLSSIRSCYLSWKKRSTERGPTVPSNFLLHH